jgi:UDP-glucose:glycoprotein glucosyltransferase
MYGNTLCEQASHHYSNVFLLSFQYLNNLQKDKKYHGWPSSVQEFLRPTFPGMLRHVAKNIFHLVFIVDPTQKPSRELLKMAEAFYVHSAPIR